MNATKSLKKHGQTLVVFCMMMAVASFAFAQEAVRIIYDYEPFAQNLSEKTGTGTATTATLLVIDKIDMPMTFDFIPISRQEMALSNSTEAVCALFKLQTVERSKHYLFSRPTAFQTSHRLYIQDDLPEVATHLLEKNGAIKSLVDVVKTYPNSSVLLTYDVSYGSYLDVQIGMLPDQQVTRVQGFQSHNIHARMFANHRTDITISSPSEMFSYLQDNKHFSYRSYRIENSPPIATSHFMCNQHPQSRRFIDQVNSAMLELYDSQAFLQAHFDYQPPEEHDIIEEYIRFEAQKLSPASVPLPN